MPRTILTVGLGYGDEAKGSVVDALVRRHKIPLVVRYSGGCQCAHNVLTDNGIHHTFSQFGSGTLAGAGTLLTQHVLIDPVRLWNEAEVLVTKGIDRPLKRLFVHRDALVITPFHAAANRLREIARGNGNRHGSCGVGIGETARYALAHPDSALRINDLLYPKVTADKLVQIRTDLWKEMEPLREQAWMKAGFHDDAVRFHDENLIEATLWRYHCLTHSGWNPVGSDEVSGMLGTMDTVFEGAQGVLIDEDYGFHPYTTWSRVTTRNAVELLKAAGIKDYESIGVLRAYSCRHGPGPFPSEDPDVAKAVEEPHNPTNQWQGSFRTGWFDVPLTRYALKVAGRIDSIALTHLDKLPNRKTWPIVINYDVDLSTVPAPEDFEARQRLTTALMNTQERFCRHFVPEMVRPFIEERLGVPIRLISRGPAANHKTFLSDSA